MNAFVTSQFNSLHESYLRIIYQEKQFSFKQLLKKGNSVSIYQRNLQSLATEMYKISNGLSPILIQKLFISNNEHTYSLRDLHQFKMPSVNIVSGIISGVP